jgi:cytochrome c5
MFSLKRFYIWLLSGCSIVWMISGTLCFAGLSGSLDEKNILERIKPIGEVTVVGGTTAPTTNKTATLTGDIGQLHYEQNCKMCHETGLAGAPKFGDKKDWAPRVAQGMDVLLKHAIEGYNAMPPRGGCMNCSDEDIKKSIEYMVNHSK